MTIRLSDGLVAQWPDLDTAFDGGTGRLNIYTGTQPASANNAASGTLLATFTLASDAFGAPSAGSAALAAVSNVTAAATGTAGWFRFYRTGDTAPGSAASGTDRRLDGAIAETTGGDLNFDETDFVAGGTVALSSYTLTQPDGE